MCEREREYWMACVQKKKTKKVCVSVCVCVCGGGGDCSSVESGSYV